jgi:hypothetical protein
MDLTHRLKSVQPRTSFCPEIRFLFGSSLSGLGLINDLGVHPNRAPQKISFTVGNGHGQWCKRLILRPSSRPSPGDRLEIAEFCRCKH